MAYTMRQVVDRARIPLNDASKTRYSDDDLLGYANAAVKELQRERPDLFFGQFSALPGDKLIGENLPIDDRYMQPIADYVAARAELVDDEAAMQTKAGSFFALFKAAKGD